MEEQYYILFPIAVLLLWPLGRRRMLWAFALAALASLLLSEWAWRHMPDANFYLLPTRAWELLVGALCSFATPAARTPSGVSPNTKVPARINQAIMGG